MSIQRTPEILEHMNTFSKCHSQAAAHINGLICEDNMSYLNDEDVASIIWAVSERLEEMKTAFKVLTK